MRSTINIVLFLILFSTNNYAANKHNVYCPEILNCETIEHNSGLNLSESVIAEQNCFTLQLDPIISNSDSILLLKSLTDVSWEYRARLFHDLYFLIIFLEKPEIVNELGEIKNIDIKWEKLPAHKYGIKYVYGEKFNLSLNLENLSKTITYSSETDFPEFLYLGGNSREEMRIGFGIDGVGEIISQIMSTLSQRTLKKIVVYEIPNDLLVQRNYYYLYLSEKAVQFINDQILLEKLLFEDQRGYVRAACVEMIKDQSLIAKAAKSDETLNVRSKALRFLKDQDLAVKIALEATDKNEIQYLIWHLTNKKVLHKLLDNSKDESIRSKIRNRLSSPELNNKKR